MKITYELDSNNPDDQEDIENLHHARGYKKALFDIESKIRSWQNFQDDETYEAAAACLDQVSHIIWQVKSTIQVN